MAVLIDADACPVVDLAVRLAARYDQPVTLVCDTSHWFSRFDVQVVTVDKGADSADFALLRRVRPGDIVVTQDYGLAAMCLAQDVYKRQTTSCAPSTPIPAAACCTTRTTANCA